MVSQKKILLKTRNCPIRVIMKIEAHGLSATLTGKQVRQNLWEAHSNSVQIPFSFPLRKTMVAK